MLENLPWRYPATFVCLTCVQIWRPLVRLQDLVHRSNISALTLTFLLGSAAWFQFAGSVSGNELCSGSTFENLFYLFLYVIIWIRGCIPQNVPLNSLNEILWILCPYSQILKGFWREWDKKVVSGSCGGWIPITGTWAAIKTQSHPTWPAENGAAQVDVTAQLLCEIIVEWPKYCLRTLDVSCVSSWVTLINTETNLQNQTHFQGTQIQVV